MSRRSRPRVAIIGGGCAGLAAAFELSRPGVDYQVTVFQQGWRLGGKGASGRGPAGRIEEHGLHVWMGYYENAFRLMRECYEELARDPRLSPMATWRDAFSPSSDVTAADLTSAGVWAPWTVRFRENAGLPGDAAENYRPRTVADYLASTAELVRNLVATTVGTELLAPTAANGPALRQNVSRLFQYGAMGGIATVLEGLRYLELLVRQLGPGAAPGLAGGILEQVPRLLEVLSARLHTILEDRVRDRDELRRLWGVIDVALATIRGSIRAGLATGRHGFDPIDRFDCREWLKMNGASDRSISSSFVRALYDLAFAYEDGDLQRPRIAAGAAMRGSLRAFFTYRGSFFWKMQAGMGDVMFAPLHEVLARRGVKFRFFHRLRNIGLGGARDDTPYVKSLEFDIQARPQGGHYAPLVEVGNLPCWPAEPRWSQLQDGETLRKQQRAFESHSDVRREGHATLEVGRDFDFVVLATGVGAIPHIGRELLARSERWRMMVDKVKTVSTRAFQLWLTPGMRELGWSGPSASLTGFVEPFDTWADMSHLARAEDWHSHPPGTIAYFCSVMPDARPTAESNPSVQAAAVKRDAITFLERDIGHLWPGAWRRPGEFRWDLLRDADPHATRSGAGRFDGQYWRANVNPTDRYTLSLPGSIEHRLSPLDVDVANMTVAGDWTASGLNLGCVEGAVMSGRLAAHAICQSPRLSTIVGFDHP